MRLKTMFKLCVWNHGRHSVTVRKLILWKATGDDEYLWLTPGKHRRGRGDWQDALSARETICKSKKWFFFWFFLSGPVAPDVECTSINRRADYRDLRTLSHSPRPGFLSPPSSPPFPTCRLWDCSTPDSVQRSSSDRSPLDRSSLERSSADPLPPDLLYTGFLVPGLFPPAPDPPPSDPFDPSPLFICWLGIFYFTRRWHYVGIDCVLNRHFGYKDTRI